MEKKKIDELSEKLEKISEKLFDEANRLMKRKEEIESIRDENTSYRKGSSIKRALDDIDTRLDEIYEIALAQIDRRLRENEVTPEQKEVIAKHFEDKSNKAKENYDEAYASLGLKANGDPQKEEERKQGMYKKLPEIIDLLKEEQEFQELEEKIMQGKIKKGGKEVSLKVAKEEIESQITLWTESYNESITQLGVLEEKKNRIVAEIIDENGKNDASIAKLVQKISSLNAQLYNLKEEDFSNKEEYENKKSEIERELKVKDKELGNITAKNEANNRKKENLDEEIKHFKDIRAVSAKYMKENRGKKQEIEGQIAQALENGSNLDKKDLARYEELKSSRDERMGEISEFLKEGESISSTIKNLDNISKTMNTAVDVMQKSNGVRQLVLDTQTRETAGQQQARETTGQQQARESTGQQQTQNNTQQQTQNNTQQQTQSSAQRQTQSSGQHSNLPDNVKKEGIFKRISNWIKERTTVEGKNRRSLNKDRKIDYAREMAAEDMGISAEGVSDKQLKGFMRAHRKEINEMIRNESIAQETIATIDEAQPKKESKSAGWLKKLANWPPDPKPTHSQQTTDQEQEQTTDQEQENTGDERDV